MHSWEMIISMFTGIVQALGEIIFLEHAKEILRYAVRIPEPITIGLKKGASVSIDGICQTVVNIDKTDIYFDAIEETLHKTTLSNAFLKKKVNIERAAKLGDEIGGHLLSGHIFATTPLIKKEKNVFTFASVPTFSKYLFSKGFIALDGVSLTLVSVEKEHFTVHLIPETLKETTLGLKALHDLVNVEIDSQTQILVESVEKFLLKS